MRKPVEGICKLCGRKAKLSYEHVPPESAFNSSSVTEFPLEEYLKVMTGKDGRMPWDFQGLHGRINQRGAGGYFLCEKCNNNTGSWYTTEYGLVAELFARIITNEKMIPGTVCSFKVQGMHPLRFFKAAMVMFCDLNNECFGDPKLRDFLLNKESKKLNTDRYCLALCMVSPGMWRVHNFAVSIIGGEVVSMSEVLCYPVGVTLYIDKPKGYTPPGLIINDFLQCEYDATYDVDFVNLPYFEINSLYVDDYRKKEDFPRYKLTKQTTNEQ